MVLPVVLLQLPIAARSPWAALKVGVQNGVPKQDTLNMPEKADGAATASTATAGYQKPGAVGAELSVLILGGSVTGGGGVGNRLELAWHNSLANVRTTVFYKGAIKPSYFLHCTKRFVARAYDVLLLDLSANMIGRKAPTAALAEVIPNPTHPSTSLFL